MKKTYLIVGDVHGKVNQYNQILQKNKGRYDLSIQIGDFGFKKQHDWFLDNVGINHKILFGNHDYYPYLKKQYSLGDVTLLDNSAIMTIRGADSIDKEYRRVGVDWFSNEQLNHKECVILLDLYKKRKPKVIISHDCPSSIRRKHFNITDYSHTSNLLQECLFVHKPDLWIFGHHHKSLDVLEGSTQFIGLSELETFRFSLETTE